MKDITTLIKSGIDWASLYFTAECDDAPQQDVRIVTAKSVYLEQLEQHALTTITDYIYDVKIVKHIIETKLQHYKPVVYQNVTFESDCIIVTIDVDKIDDDAIDIALEMIAYACNRNSTSVNFGVPLSFTLGELPWPRD